MMVGVGEMPEWEGLKVKRRKMPQKQVTCVLSIPR